MLDSPTNTSVLRAARRAGGRRAASRDPWRRNPPLPGPSIQLEVLGSRAGPTRRPSHPASCLPLDRPHPQDADIRELLSCLATRGADDLTTRPWTSGTGRTSPSQESMGFPVACAGDTYRPSGTVRAIAHQQAASWHPVDPSAAQLGLKGLVVGRAIVGKHAGDGRRLEGARHALIGIMEQSEPGLQNPSRYPPATGALCQRSSMGYKCDMTSITHVLAGTYFGHLGSIYRYLLLHKTQGGGLPKKSCPGHPRLARGRATLPQNCSTEEVRYLIHGHWRHLSLRIQSCTSAAMVVVFAGRCHPLPLLWGDMPPNVRHLTRMSLPQERIVPRKYNRKPPPRRHHSQTPQLGPRGGCDQTPCSIAQ